MKQEEKELLLRDLCARLPYGVKIHIGKTQRIEEFGDINLRIGAINNTYADVRPYLFPFSSMTEEQRNEYHELLYNPKHGINIDYFDWCHKNHLDCRGLIPMGLAKDATGLNIYKE